MLSNSILAITLFVALQGQNSAPSASAVPILACLHEVPAPAKERSLPIKDRLVLLQKRGYVIERRGIANLAIAPGIVKPPAARILGLATSWVTRDGKPFVLDLANSSQGERKAVWDALRSSPFAQSFDNLSAKSNLKASLVPAATTIVRVGDKQFTVLAHDSTIPDGAVNRTWDVNAPPSETDSAGKRETQQEVLEIAGPPLPLESRGKLLQTLNDLAAEKQKAEIARMSDRMSAEIAKKLADDSEEPIDEGTLGQFSPTFRRLVENAFASSSELNGFNSREDALKALRSARIRVSQWTAVMTLTGMDGDKTQSYSFSLKRLRY